MRRRQIILLSVLAGLAAVLAGALLAFAFIKSGLYNAGASKPHSTFTEWVTHETMIHSVRRHAEGHRDAGAGQRGAGPGAASAPTKRTASPAMAPRPSRAGMGQRAGAAAALPARRRAQVEAAGAVLDRQERDQDDRHAVVARQPVRRADLGGRGVARGQREAAAADLCRMALARAAARLSARPFPR